MNKPADGNKKLPRHSAGSMELKEGTGPITAMCPCGTFLEIYKVDKTFRIQTPESIDPQGTNPDAPWVASPISNVGSGNLSVARVLLQSREMLDAALCEVEIDKEAIVLHLHSCKEALLACESLANRVGSSIDRITQQINESGISRDNQGRGLNPFPQVEHLDLDCGAFLIHINRAIKLVCELPTHFVPLERPDSNFDHLGERLMHALGEDAPATGFVKENASTVRYLADLRNFHEHPRKTRTIINNFHLIPDGSVSPPTWQLSGEKTTDAQPIITEMLAAINFVRELAEILLIHLVIHRVSKNFPFFVEQVRDEDIDPALPIRYRLSLDFAQIRFTSPPVDS